MVPTLLDEFQTASVDAITKFMKDVGYEVVSLNADNKTDLQSQMNDVINLKPKAIIMAAVDFNAITPSIEKARAAGIPVMIFDRQITSTKTDPDLGRPVRSNRPCRGRPDPGPVEDQERIGEGQGSPGAGRSLGSLHPRNIQKGFEEKMATFPDVKIISLPAMQWEASMPAPSSPTRWSPTRTST